MCTLYQETLTLPKTIPHRSRQQPTQASAWEAMVQQEAENGLTRERIVAAAMAIADSEGLAAVSIRRIAAQLGSSPMALYHYVPSKRDLLNLMLDASNAEFAWPAETIRNWRSALSHFAWESRRCLKRHPWVSVLRASDPEYGPECIRILELLLTTLSQFGLDVRAAIRVLGVLFVFVNGFVAAETADGGAPRSPKKRRSGKQPVFSRAVLATGKFPNVARFVEMGAELPDDQAFERALHWILNGIASDLEVHVRVEPTKRRKSA
jgi:AcrR family transcriptional regulator